MRLSARAIQNIKDFIETEEATAEDDDDRQLAMDVQALLDCYLKFVGEK
jgi:hypothetical protein